MEILLCVLVLLLQWMQQSASWVDELSTEVDGMTNLILTERERIVRVRPAVERKWGISFLTSVLNSYSFPTILPASPAPLHLQLQVVEVSGTDYYDAAGTPNASHPQAYMYWACCWQSSRVVHTTVLVCWGHRSIIWWHGGPCRWSVKRTRSITGYEAKFWWWRYTFEIIL